MSVDDDGLLRSWRLTVVVEYDMATSLSHALEAAAEVMEKAQEIGKARGEFVMIETSRGGRVETTKLLEKLI